jgi:hypothetical protein
MKSELYYLTLETLNNKSYIFGFKNISTLKIWMDELNLTIK